jgi:hypothetical protein
MFKTKQLPLAEASERQIRDYAETMQLDLSDAHSETDVLAVLGAAWPFSWIPVADAPDDGGDGDQGEAALPEPQQEILVGGIGSNDPKVRLRLGETELPGGKEPAVIAVNGRTVVIQRKLVVDLPYRFYLAMRNAVRELVFSEVTNFPVLEIIAMPTADEIKRWHERTDNEIMPA